MLMALNHRMHMRGQNGTREDAVFTRDTGLGKPSSDRSGLKARELHWLVLESLSCLLEID